jgi:small subunit ribosomal protein S4
MAAARPSGAGSEEKQDMARYTGPDCKRCRREKTKLFLKGAKCDSPKCPIEIRPYPPGEHGRNRPKENDFLLQVREKQKAKRIYGILERQFHNYYEEASLTRGRTGEALLQILEARLDNVVYRAGFAKSRDMARQLVRHGHVIVNGRRVDIPSFRVSESDIVEVAAKSRELTPFVVARAEAGERTVPPWIEVIPDKMRILVHSLPVRAQIDTLVQEQLIVEYYSKQ